MREREAFDFGLRLQKLRKLKKLSQKDLGARIGVSKGTIYRYESNTQEPTLENAVKLALTLGTSLDYLVGLDHEMTVRIPDMPEEKRTVLLEFLRLFVQ